MTPREDLHRLPPSHASALIIPVPVAESVVGEHRRRLDLAAADGVPAHATVLFPWVPLDQISEDHLALLAAVCRDIGSFELLGDRVEWFGEELLVVAFADDEPMRAVIRSVADAFPSYPPYEGRVPLEQIVPHVTIGHCADARVLRDAEADVRAQLPVAQTVAEVEIWAGPAVGDRTDAAPWHRIGTVPFGC